MRRILVPIDFSAISQTVISAANSLATLTGSEITLLHVKHVKSDSEISNKLEKIVDDARRKTNVIFHSLMRDGSVFTEISEEAAKGEYDLVMIGSHGFKGIREIMFGADILKLLKIIPIPVITVLQGYHFPEQGIRKILFPVASHNSFHLIVEATAMFAKLFDAQVHLYSVQKPEIEWTDQLLKNIELAESTFRREQVIFTRINEPQSKFTIGYSKQTLDYARRIQADLIALMSVPAKEHFYFADGDKEQIITNSLNIPVISTSDRFQQ